jgi:K+-transporting ATPase ATPase C chain
MVTASGSGLDPDISPEAAQIQIERIATNRGLTVEQVTSLVNEHTEKPLAGLFGPAKVNVLKLNVALDALKK